MSVGSGVGRGVSVGSGVGAGVSVGTGVGTGVCVGSGAVAGVAVGPGGGAGVPVGTGTGEGVSGIVVPVGTGEGSTRFSQAITDAANNSDSRTISDPWPHCRTCMVVKPDRCPLKPHRQRDYMLDRPAI